MKKETAKWLSEIILTIATAMIGLGALAYVYVGLGAISWNPGVHQMHPLIWAGSLLLGVVALYVSHIAFKSAKRGGEWKWQ